MYVIANSVYATRMSAFIHWEIFTSFNASVISDSKCMYVFSFYWKWNSCYLSVYLVYLVYLHMVTAHLKMLACLVPPSTSHVIWLLEDLLICISCSCHHAYIVFVGRYPPSVFASPRYLMVGTLWQSVWPVLYLSMSYVCVCKFCSCLCLWGQLAGDWSHYTPGGCVWSLQLLSTCPTSYRD